MKDCRQCGRRGDGDPCATCRGVFDQVPGTDADMFIQWKGTDVCMDFHCSCQPDDERYSSHFDGYFAYVLECPRCGARYELGTQVKARRLGEGEEPNGRPRLLEYGED